MSEQSGARDLMNYSFLVVFANDGTIDEKEMAFIRRLALEDGEVDQQEKRVLKSIFGRVEEKDVTPQVWKEITEFKAQFKIE